MRGIMELVIAPKLPKLIVNGSGNYKYVFTYKNHWDKDGKKATRGKGDTTCVGRFIPSKNNPKLGEVRFNEEFMEKYPELRMLRTLRHKGGRLEFKPRDEDDRCYLPRDGGISRLHAGATWSLNQIVGSTPIGEALRDAFPQRNMALKILSLAYYIVVCSDGCLSNYEEFAECTWLPFQRALSSATISRLLQSIRPKDVKNFFKHLNTRYLSAAKPGTKRRYWALDSTSITSYATEISSVDYGHNKDLVQAPQTNVLFIVDQKTNAPLYFRNFDGNVPDVLTLRNTIAELAMLEIDLENVVLVMDRGYGSRKNYDDLLRNKIHFINCARIGKSSFIAQLIEENYNELLNWNNNIAYLNQTAVTVKISWYYDDFPVQNKRAQKRAKEPIYAHLYFNRDIHNEATQDLQKRLCSLVERYNADTQTLTDEQKTMVQAFTDQVEKKAVINMSKVDTYLRYAGVRVLISDVVDNALECACAYEERNQVEHAFNTMKSRLSCNRTLVHSTENWDSKLFLQFLATSIASMVRARVNRYNETARSTKKYRVHYDSDHKLLGKLNNVYITKFNEGWIFDEIAGKKKDLFAILGVPAPSAEKVTSQEEQPEAESQSVSDGCEDL